MSWQVRRWLGVPESTIALTQRTPFASPMKVSPPPTGCADCLADLDVDDHVGLFQGAHDLPEPGRLLVPEPQEERGDGVTRPDVAHGSRRGGGGGGTAGSGPASDGAVEASAYTTANTSGMALMEELPGNAARSRRTAGQSQLWRSGEAGVAARGVRRGSRTLRRWLAGVATSRGGASSRCGAGWSAAASRHPLSHKPGRHALLQTA